VEQNLLEHTSSSLVISTICVAQSLFFCVVLFLLYIVLSVLLRFTTSDYHFGIFKLFLNIYFFSNCTDRLTKGRILISNIFVYSIYVISVRRSDIVIWRTAGPVKRWGVKYWISIPFCLFGIFSSHSRYKLYLICTLYTSSLIIILYICDHNKLLST
jgi:hypothetical protein